MKIGDRVTIRTSSEFYEKQGHHGIGEVIDMSYDDSNKIWYSIAFDDKYENNYKEEDLELVHKSWKDRFGNK
jgi:hypothetical protein